MLNVVMPMAGRSQRFYDAGYDKPKQLIKVRDKTVLEWSLYNLPKDARYIFIVRTDDNRKYDLEGYLRELKPSCIIISINEITRGAACTVLKAKSFIKEGELLISDSDLYCDWSWNSFRWRADIFELDAELIYRYSQEPCNSYVRTYNGLVIEAKEKRVISHMAPNGIHWYRKGQDFIDCAEEMINKNDTTNNEFYISPIYNYMIEKGKRVGLMKADAHYSLGTPEALEEFKQCTIILN